MPLTTTLAFGPLLKSLRKQAGMTQRDLAAALGYSESLICSLEKATRQPDLQAVSERFIAALGLQGDPNTAAYLIEQAALARGERLPASITFQRTTHMTTQAEPVEALPAPPTALIGRTVEVNQLCNRLLGHSGRLLTLLGPPGIGKTTLALAVATRLQPHYPDGVVVVPLAAVSDPTLMAATILVAVGSSDLSPPQRKLIECLRRKTMLLVLDNLEQISDAAPLIAEVVAECPGICVLATSRERLHLRAEQRYKVPPLDLSSAVELFVQRAQAVGFDFGLTSHNQSTLEAICQRLDCLPLALELCAAQIDILSPTQLLAQLQDHRLDLLVDGAHDLPPRQRTLRTAIGHSYRLLTEAERLLLRTLGVFAGGFALDAAVALAIDRLEPAVVQATLHVLIGKSLVRAETLPSGEQRFLLLETIREFALEQVRAQDEEALLRQRHYAAYLQLFRTGDNHLRGAEATTWIARLEPEQDNLRTALQWTLANGRYTDAAWLLLVVGFFWMLNGHRYEVARWIAPLLPHRQTLAVELHLLMLLDFVVSAGESREFHSLEQYRAEIIALMARCPSQQIQSVAWHFLAQTHEQKARGIALARAASEAPTLGPEFGAVADHDFVLAGNQLGYAGSLLRQGEVAQATILTKDSLHRFRQRGNQEFSAECLGALSHFALIQGNLPEAYAYVQEAITIGTTYNLRIVHAEWQWLFGLVTLYKGNAKEARRLLEECLPLCLEIKNTFHLGQVCLGLAATALWAAELAQATEWLGQSLAHHPPQRITVDEVHRLFVAGRLAAAQGQFLHAATLFGRAEAAHRQIHHIYAGLIVSLADAALATVQSALEPAVFAEAFATGEQMSLEEAFVGILAPA